MLRWSIPLLPDPDEARRLAEAELAKSAYDETQANWFDRASKAIFEFFDGLFRVSGNAGVSPIVAIIVVGVIIGLAVAAYFIWGKPRWSATSRANVGALFDEDDARSAAELRRDAEAQAAQGNWNDAIVLRFRALARGLAERGAVSVGQGATVHAFAREAATAFPDAAAELERTATAFDDVRYLRRPGTEETYRAITNLDLALDRTRPVALATLEELA